MNRVHFILITLLFLTAPLSYAQGVQFNSSDDLIDERTSYEVFSQDRPGFRRPFKLEFSWYLDDLKQIGNIFSIKGAGQEYSYSLRYMNSPPIKSFLKFSLDGVENLLTIPLDSEILGAKKWIKTSVVFDPNAGKISISIDEKTYVTKVYKLDKKVLYPEIYFGKHGEVIDVPDMAIKNLYVGNEYQNYIFEFDESEGEKVYDVRGKHYGTIHHPNWLITNSYFWKHRFSLESNEVTSLAFDENAQRFLIAKTDSLLDYNFHNETKRKLRYKNPLPVPMRLGMSFVDPDHNKFFVYEVNDIPVGATTIGALNLESLTWEEHSNIQLPKQRHHHNSFLDSGNNQFYIFGGFGNQRLSNTFNRYDISSGTWDVVKFSGDIITPRYFAGLVKINDEEILLFGGLGNKSGDQSVGMKYYHDCFKVNFSTKIIQKLWELDREQANMVSSRNMVLSKDKSSFYTLNYRQYISHTYLQLYKYSIENGAIEQLGDSIPIVSERIRTNANLYLNPQTDELFCAIQEYELDGSNRIKIFSIDNPPVSKGVLDKYAKENKIPSVYSMALVLAVFVIVLLAFVILKRRRMKREHIENQVDLVKNNTNEGGVITPKENAVFLFGEFNVTNQAGRDVTYLFSPNIKKLFLMILLNSNREEAKGVTSEEIYATIWPDKTIKNAKNLKNVTLNQLRNIITELKGVAIVYTDKRFVLEFDENFYCDYYRLLKRIDAFNIDNNVSNRDLIVLLDVLKRGVFLKAQEDEYFDKYKKDVEYAVLKDIPFLIREFYENQKYTMVLSMTDILESIDSLSEISFYYKIHTYLKLGMDVKARKHYNAFVVEYKKVMDDDFTMTFREVAKRIPRRKLG